jgi:hypothetical protein
MNIYTIPLGVEHGYIIRGEGVVMIDGDTPNKAKAFIKCLKKSLIKPEEINLIILTHGHWGPYRIGKGHQGYYRRKDCHA